MDYIFHVFEEKNEWSILGKLQDFTILTLQLMYHQLQKDKSNFFY